MKSIVTRTRACIVLVLLIFAKASLFGANGRKISDIANPMKDPLACGRSGVAKSAICDPDNKLSKDIKNEIEGYINAVTSAQIAVAIVDKMNHIEFSKNNIDAAAEKFARTLHDTWGIGSQELNDGVMVFLSIKDRVVYISTGSGVDKLLSKPVIDRIINDMKPFLRKSDYGAAISTSIVELDMYLSGNKGQIHSKYHNKGYTVEEDGASSYEIAGFVLFFASVLGVSVYMSRRREAQIRGYERGRAALDSLMRDVDNTVESNRYFTASCPICLEEFPSAHPSASPTNKKNEQESSLTKLPSPSLAADKDSDSENQTLTGVDGTDEANPLLPHTSTMSVPAITSSNTAGHQALKPMALRCGHTFCAACLESFLRTTAGSKCPICRMSVEGGPPPRGDGGDHPPRRPFFPGGGDQQGGSGAVSSAATQQSQQSSVVPPSGEVRRSCADNFRTDDLPTYSETQFSSSSPSSAFAQRAPEIRFRMNRMRHLYPDVMTLELLRLMNSSVDRGNLHDFRSIVSARGAEVQRLVADIRASAAAAARRSGSGGSSGGFSGGRSSGGGGGRW